MVNIYISLDKENFILSYGKAEYGTITTNPKDSILISLPEGHEVLQGNIEDWKYIKGYLVKDETKRLLYVKEDKKKELSKACSDSILKGFDYGGYHFSYDKEAQANIIERWHLFQNEMIDSIRITAHDKNGEDIRIEYQKEEYTSLYMASVHHKENCISHYRDNLLPLVEQANSIEEVQAITWGTKVVTPAPEPIIVNDEKTLDKQLKKQKIEQVRGDEEVMGLLMMVGGMS